MTRREKVQRMRTYTTGDLAKMFNVSIATVDRWCNENRIEFHRLPGARARRVTDEAVRNFAKREGLPVPPEVAGAAE